MSAWDILSFTEEGTRTAHASWPSTWHFDGEVVDKETSSPFMGFNDNVVDISHIARRILYMRYNISSNKIGTLHH